MSKKLNA